MCSFFLLVDARSLFIDKSNTKNTKKPPVKHRKSSTYLIAIFEKQEKGRASGTFNRVSLSANYSQLIYLNSCSFGYCRCCRRCFSRSCVFFFRSSLIRRVAIFSAFSCKLCTRNPLKCHDVATANIFTAIFFLWFFTLRKRQRRRNVFTSNAEIDEIVI